MKEENIADFGRLLFRCLRQMDAEATNRSYYQGHAYPTGLRSYSMHVRPNMDASPASTPRYCTEDAWGDRLCELLQAESSITRVHVRESYPSGNGVSDLFVAFSGGHQLWLEMKGAWPYDRRVPQTYEGNPSFLKHLTSITEGVPKDFYKLRRVPPSRDVSLGVLVIGFDMTPPSRFAISNEQMALLKRNSGLDAEPWRKMYDESEDKHQPLDVRLHKLKSGFRVRCWFWYCNSAQRLDDDQVASTADSESARSSAIDKRRAMEIIDRFVQTSSWSETWSQLVEQLVEPLGLDSLPIDSRVLGESSQANLRAHWPESYSNKQLWLSRTGPWCRQDGMLKIIEIVRKTAISLSH